MGWRKKTVVLRSNNANAKVRAFHFQWYMDAAITPMLPKTKTPPYLPTQYLKSGSTNSPIICISRFSLNGKAVVAKVLYCNTM